jgi:hypothetical protein
VKYTKGEVLRGLERVWLEAGPAEWLNWKDFRGFVKLNYWSFKEWMKAQ